MTNDKTTQPAQAVPQLTGCNCRWDGETQVQWCELHAAHKEAIHDWAGRAKAAEAKLAAPQPEAQPRWQPIETAPKDGSTFLCWVAAERWSDMDGGGSGRAHDVSQIDFCWWRDNQGNGYFDPACGQIGDSQGVTHWMPLPAAPSAQAEPATCPHTGQCHPGFCPCSDARQAEQGDE